MIIFGFDCLLGKFVLICRKHTRFQISYQLYEIVRRVKRPMIIVKLTLLAALALIVVLSIYIEKQVQT